MKIKLAQTGRDIPPDHPEKYYDWVKSKVISGYYDLADLALKEVIKSRDRSICLRLIGKSYIDHCGILHVNPEFVTSASRQHVVEYFFWQLIALAPMSVLHRTSISKRSITRIRFNRYHDEKSIPASDVFCFPEYFKGEELMPFSYRLRKFPDQIYRFTKLQDLDCSETLFDVLPHALGKCKGLKRILIQHGSFKKLPDSIGNLKSLEVLVILWGFLEDLPASLGKLKKLRLLRIEHTALKKFPSVLPKLKALQYLSLAHNNITKFNSSIFKCRNLVSLNLRKNNLAVLPDGIKSLTKLRDLNLGLNKIERIETGITRLKNLDYIDLTHNPFVFGRNFICKIRKGFSMETFFNSLRMEIDFSEQSDPFYGNPDFLKVDFEQRLKAVNLTPEQESKARMIFDLLNNNLFDRTPSVIAALRLLLGTRDPKIAEICLSRYVAPDLHVVKYDIHYQHFCESIELKVLTEYLLKRDFPLLIGKSKFRSRLKYISIQPGDVSSKVLKDVFPSLTGVALCFLSASDAASVALPDEWLLAAPEVYVQCFKRSHYVIESSEFRSRYIQFYHCEFSDLLSLKKVGSLERLDLVKTKCQSLQIEACLNLKSLNCSLQFNDEGDHLTGKRDSNPCEVLIDDCPSLETIRISDWLLKKLTIRKCPRLREVVVEGRHVILQELNIKGSNQIRVVRLKDCGLESIPEPVTQLKNLENLDLRGNSIRMIPESVAGLKNLKILKLAGNLLYHLPLFMTRIKSLEVFEFGKQNLHGDLDEKLRAQPQPAALPALQFFLLPDSGIENWTNLKYIDTGFSDPQKRKFAWRFRRSRCIV